MPTSQLNGVIRHLRRAVFLRGVQDLTDGQLLDRYIVHREETAFESLVRRHGPMVLGVCRRILRHHHDVEDAFQATFLVLVRKAASIRPKEMVANWLYGVAHNTALKARALAMKRQMMEKQVSETPEPQVKQRDQNGNLQRLLDQELSALPEKYRILVVLCDLEGKTRKEAAEQLGWPEGTVSGRLARARVMLAKRLSRPGLALSGGAVALALAQKVASASVPSSFVISTVEVAAIFTAGNTVAGAISANVISLTEGVLKAMLYTKLKVASAVLVVIGFLGTTGSLLTLPANAEKLDGPGPGTPIVALQKPARPNQDIGIDVIGQLKAVDTSKKIIVLTLPPKTKREPGEEITLDLAKETKVFFDDGRGVKTGGVRAGKFTDLKVGATVYIELSSNKKEVVAIRALGPTVAGVLKAVDAEKNTVTLARYKKKGADDEDQTYTVAKDAKVFIDGKEAQFNGLATEALVVVKLSGDQKEIGMIQTEGPSVQGILVAVDSEKNVITLTTPKKGEPTGDEFTYPVAKNAKVVIYGREAKFKDLAQGSLVTAKLSSDRKEVGIITAQGPTVQGVLKSVDVTNNTVTVLVLAKGKAGEEKTFNVVKDAPVTNLGETGRLADLEKERQVILWLSADQKMVVSISSHGKKAMK